MQKLETKFWIFHAVIPALIFALLAFLVEWSQFDLVLARALYDLEGGGWVLRENFILNKILHNGGRKIVVFFSGVVLVLACASFRVGKLKPFKRDLWFLIIALATSPLLVGIGKKFTHMDCPWDLTLFGGQYPYVSLLEAHPGTWRYGRCFPSGHASGGYCLFALYFFFREVRPRWAKAGLATGFFVGVFFGIVQQVRGAHFLSHDLWSLAICWFTSLFLYWLFYRQPKLNGPDESCDNRFEKVS